MSDTYRFAAIIALTSAVVLVAVLSNRLTARIKVPLPLLMLVVAAAAVQIFPSLPVPPEGTVERVVTVALVLILFDGGMHIGWDRFRSAAGPIATVGLVGTFLTAAGDGGPACCLRLPVVPGLVVATAVSPTDPAVVFSVLGQREVAGRSGTILEGESGANDPVGIALMAGLLAAGALSWAASGSVGLQFVLQMLIGAALGVAGGRALLWFIRKVTLPSEGLYPLRTLACALLLYGVTTLAHGSGFLAVFVAGILVGHRRAPYQREIERFHSALAGLAEIVAFVVLGLTIDLAVLARTDVWVPGLILGVVLAVVIRPVFVGLCLIPARLQSNERTFVLFAGLKGAVPILLGEMLRVAHVPGAERLYGIVVVVVIFSVLVQGSLVPIVAHRLRLPMRRVEPEPWAIGVRLREEPEGAHEVSVVAGSAVDGKTVEETADLAGDIWISIVVRHSHLVPVRPDTRLEAGDSVVILAEADLSSEVADLFTAPARTPASSARRSPSPDLEERIGNDCAERSRRSSLIVGVPGSLVGVGAALAEGTPMAAIDGAPTPGPTPGRNGDVEHDGSVATTSAMSICTRSLGKRYGTRWAVRDLDLTVESGEVFGFLGPNGAGKSTTIRMLMGMARPSAGDAWLAVSPVADVEQAHRHVAYVPAEVALWPNLTGTETLELLAHLGPQPDLDYRDRVGRPVRSRARQTGRDLFDGQPAEGGPGRSVRDPGTGTDPG